MPNTKSVTETVKKAQHASTGKTAPAPKAMKAELLFDVIGNKAELLARIGKLKTAAGDLQHEVHVLACSVMAHVSKHGNIGTLTAFLDACPAMIRVNALQSWFEHFGQVSFTPPKDDPDAQASWRLDKSKKLKLGEAMAKPFWKFKANEGAPYEPLDMSKWLERAIKQLTKDAEKTGRKHDHLVMFLKTYNVDEKPATLGDTAPGTATVPLATIQQAGVPGMSAH